MGGTQFKQKRGWLRTSLDFGEEELTYTFDNSRTRVGSSIPYHEIPGRTNYREVRMWWLRYVLVFYLTFCVVTIIYYSSINSMEALSTIVYVATLGFLMVWLLALLRRQGGMTSFRLDTAIIVLHDGQQQAILDEIMKRRLDAMRKKLAHVDFNRPYYEEAARFGRLKEEGVITEQEYRNARQKIAAMRGRPGFSPPHQGNMN